VTVPRVQPEISRVGRVAALPFIALIWVYRFTLSPFVGRQCRFQPTCSIYGLEAYRLHGPIRGTRLTLARILRCHPFRPGGYDPVPLPGVGPSAPSQGTTPNPPNPPGLVEPAEDPARYER
jgi:putative membrane protein insertion efficiency factor